MQAMAFRLHPGQDLVLGLEEFIRQHSLQAACVLTCVGSLQRAVLRLADLPAAARFTGPFEIVSLTGTLSMHGSHCHLSISDSTGKTIGGHLMPGCIIYTTAEIVLGVLPGIRFTRPVDPETTYDELMVQSE